MLSAAAVGGWFAVNAAVTGEFNYQGGDRKTFYGSFPFESPTRDVWTEKTELVQPTTGLRQRSESSQLASRVLHNVELKSSAGTSASCRKSSRAPSRFSCGCCRVNDSDVARPR